MTSKAKIIIILLLTTFFSGCSIRHVVSDDYPTYLNKQSGTLEYTKTDYTAQYIITPETANHLYEFRAGSTGIANQWVVKFGTMLEATLESDDVQQAFKKLSKSAGGGSDILTFTYKLVEYKFEHGAANVTMQITASKSDTVLFDQTYEEKGNNQKGKMVWTGVFGMRNAIHQSTNLAISRILNKSLTDLMAKKIHNASLK